MGRWSNGAGYFRILAAYRLLCPEGLKKGTMAISFRFTREDVTTDGVLMLSLGSLLFALEPFMVKPTTELNGYRAAVILTVGVLCLGGVRLLRSMRGDGTHMRLIYGLIAELSIACWVAAWIIQSSPLDLRLLILLAGLHGTLWGIWLLKLAIQLNKLTIRAAVVGLLAAGTSASGIAIAVESDLTRITALTLVACYTMYIGVVIVSLELFLYRALTASADSPVAREIVKGSTDLVHPMAT